MSLNKPTDKQIETFNARLSTLQAHRNVQSTDMQTVVGLAGRANSPYRFTVQVSIAFDLYKVDFDTVAALPQKQIKRVIQMLHAVNAKDYKAIDPTTARILYAMRLAGETALTFDAIKYLVSNKLRDGAVSPETRGVSARTLGTLFAGVDKSTGDTQVSRTVGANGFLQATGATSGKPGTQNRAVTLNAAHPLVVAFFACIDAATDAQLREVTGAEGDAE